MIRTKEESRKDKKIKEDAYSLAPSVRPTLSFRIPPVVVLAGKGIIGKEEEQNKEKMKVEK